MAYDAKRTESGEDAERKRREWASPDVSRDVPSRPDVSRSQTQTKTQTEEPPLPPNLNLDAWQQWITYRKRIRKALNPASYPEAMRAMAAMGTNADQLAAVRHSMSNGFTGLYAPKSGPPRAFAVVPTKSAAELEAEARSQGVDIWADR